MSPTRNAVVAGRFYPGTKSELTAMLDALASAFPAPQKTARPFILMMPHAGYIFSGPACAATLTGVEIPETLIILCPNHTGLGQPFGVWTRGEWLTPLGSVPVQEKLASLIVGKSPFSSDLQCHLREHSIEVVLPFLQYMSKGHCPAIVPICIGTQNPEYLRLAGENLAQVIETWRQEHPSTAILVSSDMNHYESEEVTRHKDSIALNEIGKEDPPGLLAACRRNNITMCGAGPMAMALFALQRLRDKRPASRNPAFIIHDTSARATHDSEHVVGYAGVHCFL